MRTEKTFISYTGRDLEWAKRIRALFISCGCEVWMQKYDIKPGDNFITKMNEFVKNSDSFIPVISSAYYESGHCDLEYSSALKKHAENDEYLFLPVRIEDVPVKEITGPIVYEDLFGVSDSEADSRLLNIIEAIKANRKSTLSAGATGVSSQMDCAQNLPERCQYFTGRQKQLDDIRGKLERTHRATLSGGGGCGKTTIAVEYAYRSMDDGIYDYIWMVNADRETEIENGYRAFAKKLGLPVSGDMNFEDVLGNVKEWLGTNERWLLIFDNAEGLAAKGTGKDEGSPKTAAEKIRGYLPSGKPRGHVLVTTREYSNPTGKRLKIETFEEPDALGYLEKRLTEERLKYEPESAGRLAEALGNLPLGLVHAASYMIEMKYNCAQYLNLLEKRGMELFGKPVSDIPQEKMIGVTWDVSVRQINSKPAEVLFNLCAYCAPDDIPLSLFIEGRDELPEQLRDFLKPEDDSETNDGIDDFKVNDLLTELSRYSLLTFNRDEENNVFLSMHRLIQTVVREKLKSKADYITRCLNMARKVFRYKYGNIESMKAFKHNVAHMLEIARHAEKALTDDGSQKKAAWIYNEAAVGFMHSGDYKTALEWYFIALPVYEKVHETEQSETAAVYNNIGLVYKNQGEYDKALEWHFKALAIDENVLGTENPNTAIDYNNIGAVYYNQGEYEQALEWFFKALAIDEKVNGNEHPHTATAYNDIGGVYDKQGEYEQALEWYFKALAIYEKVKNTSHPFTATTYNNIAGVYYSQGEYEQALEWYFKALTINEKVNGTEHPKTAIRYNNIGYVYNNQGEYEQALEWYQKSYRIRLQKLGAGHPSTIATQTNMQRAYNSSALSRAKPFGQWLAENFPEARP